MAFNRVFIEIKKKKKKKKKIGSLETELWKMKHEKWKKKKKIVRAVLRLEFHEVRGCNYSVWVDCDSIASTL